MEIITQILSWPVIVQGALGSGLFWLILVYGQFATKVIKKLSGNRKEEIAARDRMIMEAVSSDNVEKMLEFQTEVIYISLHYIVKALIFIVLGISIESFIPAFGIVGYIGGIAYLFQALLALPNLSPYYQRYLSETEVDDENDNTG